MVKALLETLNPPLWDIEGHSVRHRIAILAILSVILSVCLCGSKDDSFTVDCVEKL